MEPRFDSAAYRKAESTFNGSSPSFRRCCRSTSTALFKRNGQRKKASRIADRSRRTWRLRGGDVPLRRRKPWPALVPQQKHIGTKSRHSPSTYDQSYLCSETSICAYTNPRQRGSGFFSRSSSSRDDARNERMVHKTCRLLYVVLFGPSYPRKAFGAAWLGQRFKFRDVDSVTPFGLRQFQRGPCGIVAAVQAALMTVLLRTLMSLGDPRNVFNTSKATRTASLQRAIREIIEQAGDHQGTYMYVLGQVDARAVGSNAFTSLRIYPLARDSIDEFVASKYQEIKNGGVVNLLISVVLSVGLEAIRQDLDRPLLRSAEDMVTATQEAVNLVLYGELRSPRNVRLFDVPSEPSSSRSSSQQSDLDIDSPFDEESSSEASEAPEIRSNLPESTISSRLRNLQAPVWVLHRSGPTERYTVLFGITQGVLSGDQEHFWLFHYVPWLDLRQPHEYALNLYHLDLEENPHTQVHELTVRAEVLRDRVVEAFINAKWPNLKITMVWYYYARSLLGKR